MEEIRTQLHDALSPGYTALSESAALVEFPQPTILRLTGKDPVGMLAAVLTNEIPPGERIGVYAALLNPKGRVQTDLRVSKNGDEILVDTGPEGAAAAKEILGRYAPFSRVKMEDLSSGDDAWGMLGLYGPQAKELIGAPDLTEHETATITVGESQVLVAGVARPVGGYDLICPSSTLDAIRDHLLETGATLANQEDYETARISTGIPRFGVDVTPDNFPGESDNFLQRTVSFGKGCYPGQETVARMHYRGSPNKKLYRFELEPGSTEPPEAGDEIFQGEDTVGFLTSIAPLQVDGKSYALGYLTRKADPDSPMSAEKATVLSTSPA
ncbi:MAG TPA: hypothetical protein VHM69_10395 [Rubrobacter sp.]|nr:hypothetical protein [Rubrobacter sp.]